MRMYYRIQALGMRLFVALAVITLGVGCADLPPTDYTVQDVGILKRRQDASLLSLTVGYAPQAQQDKVRADSSIPPLWKEALQDAVNRSLVFRDNASKKVNLSVRITRMHFTPFLVTAESRVAAIYEIVDRNNGDILFSEKIESVGTAGTDISVSQLVRLTEANNRAVRNNISTFLNHLENSSLNKPVFKSAN